MKKALYAIAIAATFTAPAFAQSKSDWDKIVLEEARGSVMTSTGAEYQTASVGKLLVVGENMMLSTSSKAKVVYYELDDEGKVVDKCVKDYTDPSTYIIDATCTPVAAWAGSPGMSPALIIGAGVVGAALINTDDKVDVGPLSSSVRHL